MNEWIELPAPFGEAIADETRVRGTINGWGLGKPSPELFSDHTNAAAPPIVKSIIKQADNWSNAMAKVFTIMQL